MPRGSGAQHYARDTRTQSGQSPRSRFHAVHNASRSMASIIHGVHYRRDHSGGRYADAQRHSAYSGALARQVSSRCWYPLAPELMEPDGAPMEATTQENAGSGVHIVRADADSSRALMRRGALGSHPARGWTGRCGRGGGGRQLGDGAWAVLQVRQRLCCARLDGTPQRHELPRAPPSPHVQRSRIARHWSSAQHRSARPSAPSRRSMRPPPGIA